MNRYNSYKDSGIEWIGEIPKHWGFLPLKYFFYFTKGKNGQLLTSSFIDENKGVYPVYSGMTLNEGILGYWNNYEFNFDKNVIFTTTVGAKFMTTKLLTNKFSLSQNCLLMIPITENINSDLIEYFLQFDFKYRRDLIPTIIQPSLRIEDLNTYQIIVPPIQEQEQIVAYLDKKTAIVDTLITSKEQKINLLKEKRTALINHVITKGLDPNVKLKDSSVEWIGEIPVHWEIKKLRYLGECQNGISIGAEFFGKGFPFVSYGDVYKNEILPNNVTGLVDSSEIERERFSVCKGDVFFTRTSETIKEIGIASVCNSTIENSTFAGFLIRFRPTINSIFNGFSRYIFSSYIPRIYFVKEMNLVTRASLSQELLKRLPVLLPPFDEQIEISIFLDKQTQEIDELISLEQKKIETLKEYRQALISEVVTGKIKVVKD